MHRRRPQLGGATVRPAECGSRAAHLGLGKARERCWRTAAARGSSGADVCLLGMLLSSAAINSSSAAVLQLRRGRDEASVRETDGKRVQVSAVVLVVRRQAREKRKREQQHGCVIDVHLGHGGAPRRARATTVLRQRLRPPGGAREVGEWGNGAGTGVVKWGARCLVL